MIKSKRNKSTLFDEHRIPTEGSDSLFVAIMNPKPPVQPKRLALIPPLIGAGASQSLIIFRNLTRRGTILMSFEYRGHPRSTGIFELDRTISDTHYAIRWAEQYASERGLPLHAFAMCYGVVTLASQFKNDSESPIKSVSAVSGLFSLDQIVRFEDYAPTFSKHVGVDLHDALQDPAIGSKVDWHSENTRNALQEYLSGLFPELRVTNEFFEELQYNRVNMRNTLQQLIDAEYLEAIRIPSSIPCHVIYGTNDILLSLNTPQGREKYRQNALRVMPQAIFHERDVDHYGRGPGRHSTIETVGDVFEETEVKNAYLNKTTNTCQEIT